jgi:hypothetical protein
MGTILKKIKWPKLFIITGTVLLTFALIGGGLFFYSTSQQALSSIKSNNPNLDCSLTGFGYYESGHEYNMVFRDWGYSYECSDKESGYKDDTQHYFLNSNGAPSIVDPTLTKKEITASFKALSKKIPLNSVLYLERLDNFGNIDAYFPMENYVPITPDYLSLPLISASAGNGDVYLIKYSNGSAKVVASYNSGRSDLIKKED